MLKLDGSIGEGGGQILRTALALSTVTGTPVHLEKIRAGRAKSGLLRQHLTAVLAAVKVCGAQVEGAHLGSHELWFTPGKVMPGDYHFAIGSAGSTSLVLQTVLPPLLTASGPSTVTLEGGTHNTHAPPFDFLARTFVPLINRMGPSVSIALERHGFYPAGGGRMVVNISPVERLQPLGLTQRGPLARRTATALVAGLPREIGDRELAVVATELDWPAESLQLRHLRAGHGQGNVLLLEVSDGVVCELVTGFGQRGVRAEAVAGEAVQAIREYLQAEIPVGRHLADQLLLPMAMAGGGAFTTLPLSLHAETNIGTIGMFLNIEISVQAVSENTRLLTIGRRC